MPEEKSRMCTTSVDDVPYIRPPAYITAVGLPPTVVPVVRSCTALSSGLTAQRPPACTCTASRLAVTNRGAAGLEHPPINSTNDVSLLPSLVAMTDTVPVAPNPLNT